jgi:cytochrome c biogenesis protein
VALTKNQTIHEIELRDGSAHALPFAVRCDGAGQENYPDGSPRRWWSQLAVLENGREVLRKEIEVNDPLVYGGLRFFQSSYGSSGEVGAVTLRAARSGDSAAGKQLTISLGERAGLDDKTTVTFAAFVPDFVVVGGRIETRSNQPNNPAIQLLVEAAGAAEPYKVWLFPRFPDFAHPSRSPYQFEFLDMETGYYTGLQVAYEPGQWAVWAGCILMAVGLMMAFYMVHIRLWAVPLTDARGRSVLWVGASASKNREEFELRFRRLVETIETEVKEATQRPAPDAPVTIPARA